jgi:hypothetical protein
MRNKLLSLLLVFTLAALPASAYKVLVKIPATAKVVDRTSEQELYLNEDEPATEETPAVVSVYVKDIKTGKATWVLTSNPLAEGHWEEMKDNKSAQVTHFDVAAISKACFLPGSKGLIYLEGCPDSRNIWSFVVEIKTRKTKQLPATEGLLSIDAAKQQLHLSAYGYHAEGGRYSVEKVFTYDGIFISETYLGEE